MNAEEIVAWVNANTWGSDKEDGERCSYETIEVRRLVDTALQTVPRGGVMVEIGVYGGRTLAALLLVARELGAEVWAADPFVWNGDIAEPHMKEMLTHFKDVKYHFHRVESEKMRAVFPAGKMIDLLHIDGDHYAAGVDCKLWFPLLKSGGVVVFHDVVNDPRSPVYEGVYVAIQPYIKDWELLWWAQDEEGHQMGRRKP